MVIFDWVTLSSQTRLCYLTRRAFSFTIFSPVKEITRRRIDPFKRILQIEVVQAGPSLGDVVGLDFERHESVL